MSKGILLSVIIAMIAIPVWAARAKNPRAGLKKAILFTIAFNVFYMLALRFAVHM
jgi:hypothetical protein